MPQGDFSTVSGFGQIQPNTAVLPQDTTVLDTYFKVAEKQHAEKLFDYKKKQDDINRYLEQTNYDLEGIYPEDEEELNNQMAEAMKFVEDNPTALMPTMSDPESRKLHREFNDKFRGGMTKVAKSKAARVRNEALMDLALKNPNDYDIEEVSEAIKQNRAAGLERGDTELRPKFDYNMVQVLDDLAKQTGTLDTTGKAQNIGGGLVKTTTTTEYDPKEIDRLVDLAWKDDYSGTQKHFNKVYAALPETSVEKLKYKTPEEFGKATLKAGYAKIKEQKDKTQGINYAPQRAGKTVTEKDVSDRKALIDAIQNKDEQALDILRGLKYGGKPVKSVEYVTEPIEGSPTIIEITTQDGSVVQLEVSDKTGGGFFAINQFINDLEGQQKIAVEDFKDKSEDKKSVPSTSESGIKWQK